MVTIPIRHSPPATVDNRDRLMLAGHEWRLLAGCPVVVCNGSPVSMPQLITGKLCAHRNGNRLDCRRANLVPMEA